MPQTEDPTVHAPYTRSYLSRPRTSGADRVYFVHTPSGKFHPHSMPWFVEQSEQQAVFVQQAYAAGYTNSREWDDPWPGGKERV